MKRPQLFTWIAILLLANFLISATPHPQKSSHKKPAPKFRVLVLYENGGHHLEFSKRAMPWLNKLAADKGFAIDYFTNTDSIDREFLKRYKLFLQLDYPPYAWKEKAVTAFEDYIQNGKGGWIGLHHATLLGEFDGYQMWNWYSEFMGGIRFKNYIKDFAAATVKVEASKHPVFKNMPAEFLIEKEEWYTYDKSPRPNVKVLAAVDESTYKPDYDIKMGDHPVIWTNEKMKAKNLYIFMGHSPTLFDNKNYTTLLQNAIIWAAK